MPSACICNASRAISLNTNRSDNNANPSKTITEMTPPAAAGVSRHSRLGVILLLSIALHGGVFLSIRPRVEQPSLTTRGSELSVILLRPEMREDSSKASDDPTARRRPAREREAAAAILESTREYIQELNMNDTRRREERMFNGLSHAESDDSTSRTLPELRGTGTGTQVSYESGDGHIITKLTDKHGNSNCLLGRMPDPLDEFDHGAWYHIRC